MAPTTVSFVLLRDQRFERGLTLALFRKNGIEPASRMQIPTIWRGMLYMTTGTRLMNFAKIVCDLLCLTLSMSFLTCAFRRLFTRLVKSRQSIDWMALSISG
jgi:hypothetical protein